MSTPLQGPINLGVLSGARIPHWVPPHRCDSGPAWSQTARPSTTALSVAYLNGVFVAACRTIGGPHSGTVITSTDGIHWTQSAELPITHTFSPVQIAFGNGIYVANTDASTETAQSPDLVNWTVGTGNPNVGKATVLGMWFGNGLFVICAANIAEVFASPNASGQVTHATPAVFNTGIYDAATGLHFGCDRSSGDIYSSADLVTWALRGTTSFTGFVSTKRLVTNGGGRLIAIDGTTQRNFVSYSHDGGVTWNNSTGLPIPAVFYVDLLYVTHLQMWLLTDKDGRVFISLDDGVTWVEAASNLTPFLGSNQNWWMAGTPEGFLYVAVPVTSLDNTVAAVGIC